MPAKFTRLAPGSLILVTGGTGFIGSAVAVLLLDKGYKVRIATRSAAKQQPFQATLNEKYGHGSAEFVEVDDYASEQAWDSMLQGVSGVQHLASDVSFGLDYERIIKSSRDMTTTFLTTVQKYDAVKSVVLTSSRIAAFNPQYGQDIHVTKKDWADYFLDVARDAKDDNPGKPFLIYAASKVVEERVAWEFVEQNKPHFAFNAVLPDFVSGPVSNPSPGSYSTHGWLNEILAGKLDGYGAQAMNPASRLVDVRDVAALHVAALLDETTDRRRLFVAPHKFTLNKILAVWRDAFPDKQIPSDVQYEKQPEVEVDDEESTVLLRDFLDRDWISLEESVIRNAEDVV